MKLAVFVPPLAAAEIFTTVDADTGLVATVNCTLDDPVKAVTVVGILCTAFEPLTTVRVTVVSEFSTAGKVTVPVVLPPPVTLGGAKVKFDGRSAVTVNIPVFVTPFAVAVIFTCVFVDTECTVTDHWALDEPAVTVTLVGGGGYDGRGSRCHTER